MCSQYHHEAYAKLLYARQILAQPLLGQLVQLPDLVGLGEIGLAGQRTFGTSVHHLQLDLAVARRVEDEAHRIRDALVVVDHLVSVDNVSRLVAGQLLL